MSNINIRVQGMILKIVHFSPEQPFPSSGRRILNDDKAFAYAASLFQQSINIVGMVQHKYE